MTDLNVVKRWYTFLWLVLRCICQMICIFQNKTKHNCFKKAERTALRCTFFIKHKNEPKQDGR